MNKPVLKIWFSDFWSDVNNHDNYFVRLLAEKYNIEFNPESPDIVFFSCYGNQYLQYKCLRVFYTAENWRVDFSSCDFALGFDYLTRQNYFRLPLYIYYLYGNTAALVKTAIDPYKILHEKKEFCNMIVSNPNSAKRISFFEKLSQYKKVDSGGRYMNNIGGTVTDKIPFIRDYKFSFAFENSSYPGYTTEKIMEPMVAYSVPIYWGNPLIQKEFNTKSFVNCNEYKNDEAVIERIIALDQDDEQYMQVLREPYLYNNDPRSLDFDQGKLIAFLDKIINSIGAFTPIAATGMKYVHEIKRKYIILRHEAKKKLGRKGFR